MAHASQERYSALVDAKLRATLVTRDNAIFNTRYEGSPKAGKVKIPVRDTEVAVKAYDKANGVDADAGTTTYLDLDIDNDEAVNEIIDGFDAASVPDGITAERLDSAAYSMALSIDKKSIEALQSAAGATISATKTACTASTAYKEALAAKRTLSRNGVPQNGRSSALSIWRSSCRMTSSSSRVTCPSSWCRPVRWARSRALRCTNPTTWTLRTPPA